MNQKRIKKRIARQQKKKQARVGKRGELRMPPAVHGHVSSQIGIIVLAAFVILLAIAYLTHGASHAIIGAFGLIVLMLSIFGVFQAVIGFGEPNRDQAPSKRGLAFNIIVLMLLLIIFFGGLRNL